MLLDDFQQMAHSAGARMVPGMRRMPVSTVDADRARNILRVLHLALHSDHLSLDARRLIDGWQKKRNEHWSIEIRVD